MHGFCGRSHGSMKCDNADFLTIGTPPTRFNSTVSLMLFVRVCIVLLTVILFWMSNQSVGMCGETGARSEPRNRVSIVVAPALESQDDSARNGNYVSNRLPLVPSRLIALPPGAVTPQGWLAEMLRRQRDGLTGHLGEISAWLTKEGNAWLSRDGKGKYGWEELPYWLKGYIELAYLMDDPDMIAESEFWIEGVLASQRADGDFGPDQRLGDGTRDYWANMVMLYCLQSYYEYGESRGEADNRVLELMTRYFRYQATVPDDEMLTGYWQKMRGGDNLQSIYWLYNRTGDEELLEVAEKLHRCTANWTLPNDLPNWHNVNIAECFREPATYYLQSRDSGHLQAAYANFHEVRKRFGQVPGGMFGGDENCRVGFDDPRQATETCGFVEQMLSDEIMLQITGDPFWADHCENVAFNSYPAAVMPDFKSLRYLTAPNMVLSDAANHAPGIDNSGPFLVMNPFSSRCCQHNHSHGWPYFAKHLWMATPDNGLCAAMYSASEVNAKVGDGKQVQIRETTRYPFDEKIALTIQTDEPVTFPLYMRVPKWCEVASLDVAGDLEQLANAHGKYVRIEREWHDGDTVTLDLPMQTSLQTWAKNHNSVSVNFGPLTFSLKIGERYDRKDSKETAIGDSSWQPGVDQKQWPSYEIHPSTKWNYGLILDQDDPASGFEVHRHPWPADDFPFTQESAPITMSTTAKVIPEWTLDNHGLCAVLQDSPVRSDQPSESVSLVPMGAARLRISAFPVIGADEQANEWKALPKPRESDFVITSSHRFHMDSHAAIDDGLVPVSSGDHSIPRFTWWDHKGTREWVQYDFPEPRDVSSVSLYWFDDTGVGECRVPQSWRLLYRDGQIWKPVLIGEPKAARKDGWDTLSFASVSTDALRVEVQLRSGVSGGILEWKVGAVPQSETTAAISEKPPASHRVLLGGNGRLAIVERTGEVAWEMPWSGIHDLQLLENGNVLTLDGPTRVVEINPSTRQVVWRYDASTQNRPDDRHFEIHSAQLLNNGNVMIAESGAGRIIEVDRQGKLLRETKLTLDHSDSHSDTRLVRQLENGNYLVAHEADGMVREYDSGSGDVVWDFAVPMFGKEPKGGHGPDAFGNRLFCAMRHPNGNTWISTGNGHSVIEVTPEKEIVWQLHQDDLPGIRLGWVTTLELLENGNVVLGNCHAGAGQPILVEVIPDTKQVVWVLDRHDDFGNDVSNSLLIDQSGTSIR